jgi:hypothetical protein
MLGRTVNGFRSTGLLFGISTIYQKSEFCIGIDMKSNSSVLLLSIYIKSVTLKLNIKTHDDKNIRCAD